MKFHVYAGNINIILKNSFQMVCDPNFRNIYAPLVQNSKLLLICTRHGCNPCTKFGINQVKGSKDIERTTNWARKSGLTLTFEYVT